MKDKEKKDWHEFRMSGMLDILNEVLRTHGWEIYYEYDGQSYRKDVYPVKIIKQKNDNL